MLRSVVGGLVRLSSSRALSYGFFFKLVYPVNVLMPNAPYLRRGLYRRGAVHRRPSLMMSTCRVRIGKRQNGGQPHQRLNPKEYYPARRSGTDGKTMVLTMMKECESVDQDNSRLRLPRQRAPDCDGLSVAKGLHDPVAQMEVL